MSDGSRLNAMSYGTTTIGRLEEPGEVFPRLSSGTRVELCTWHPPAELAGELPEGYELQVACCTLEGGTRYFRFVGEVDSFMRVARAGGLAVLLHEKRISPEDATRYRVMFQLYDWLRSRGLRLERTFTAALDLVLRRRSRDSPFDRDILPEMLGFDAQGKGTRWSVDKLLDEGRASTTDIGMVNPSQDEVIAHGLMVAAQRNPLHVEAERVSRLVRSAHAPRAGGSCASCLRPSATIDRRAHPGL